MNIKWGSEKLRCILLSSSLISDNFQLYDQTFCLNLYQYYIFSYKQHNTSNPSPCNDMCEKINHALKIH